MIVKGIYKKGQIFFTEKPNIEEETEVLITFLGEKALSKPKLKKRIIGIWEGEFSVPEDFNEPLDDLQDYMY